MEKHIKTKSTSHPKLCLFDASGYLFRAYHALPPMSTSKGEPVNAVYGFSRMISKVLKSDTPDYVAVCFDTPKPTFRHEEFEEYKATRIEPEDDMIAQIPVAEELVEKWGLPVVKAEGFEADDAIATLALKAQKKGWDVIILSGDKDILQLVSDQIHVRDEVRKVEYDPAKVVERYGVGPDQLVDLLCLMGDKVDNVPGVPGVGEKTAAKLLAEKGTLEKLFKHLNGTKPALKEKLLQHQEQVLKNRRLIRLRDDVPLNRDLNDFKPQSINKKELGKLLQRLEFRGEFYGLDGEAAEAGLAQNKKRKVTTVLTKTELSSLEKALRRATHLSYDLETDSPDPHHCDIVGIALSIKEAEAWYIPMGHQYIGVPKQLLWDEIKPVLTPFFENKDVVKCGQNIKFDNAILKRYGLIPKGKSFDTMIAAYCLDTERATFGLKDLAASYLKERMTRYSEVVGGKKEGSIAEVPIENVSDYAGADAEVVIRLVSLFKKRLEKENVQDLFENLEMPLIHVLQDMESVGVAIDGTYLETVGRRFRKQMGELEAQVFKLAGEEFKLNSPKQLSRILFEKLKLPVVKRTKTGFSTNEAVLTKLAKEHPICETILSYRELAKLTSTYVDSLLSLVDPKAGRIRTSFHQTGTSTGRLSSTEPNLQNIPIRSEHGREIRKAFVASKDHVLLSADYSQIDLRALAHMSEDKALVEAFQQGGDIHTRTASQVFHVKPDEVTSDMRRKAKAINFGIVYGQQAWGLSQGIGVTPEEAQAFIDQYFQQYSGVQAWIEKTLEEARKKGEVITLAGRRRRIPDIHSENNNVRGFAERIAVNTPIQGSSADIIKAAMIKVFHDITDKGLKTKMIVQVHDELLFDVPKTELADVMPLIRSDMETAMVLHVPLVVDIKVGSNWNEMEKQ